MLNAIWLASCILWSSAVAAGGATGGVVFQEETIVVTIAAESITVSASYVFRNDTPRDIEQDLFYPLPIDSLHPAPNHVTASAMGRNISVRNARGGAAFTCVVPARDTVTVHVDYTQASYDGTGCYILTSTSAWNRPLEQAHIEVHVPPALALDSISYTPDADSHDRNGRHITIRRSHFMPELDLCLRWKATGRDDLN